MLNVVVSFDLKSPQPGDYAAARQVLAGLALAPVTPDGSLRLPTTTYMGVTRLTMSGLRDVLHASFLKARLTVACLLVAEVGGWAAEGTPVRVAS